MNIVDTFHPKYYKPAELIIPRPSAKDKRWYIKFYVYDVQQQKVIRKRFFSFPEGNSEMHRKIIAQGICEDINRKLKAGKVAV
jgi:hypothetical protein